MFMYFLLYLLLYQVFASLIILDKGVFPLVPDSVGIQFFIDLENGDNFAVCTIKSLMKKCCLRDLKSNDCEKIHVYGATMATVGPKDREILVHVYPTIIQHDQVGYCDFVLEHRCGPKRRRSKQGITITFDTRLFNDDDSDKSKDILEDYIKHKKSIECDSLDQDSLKDCAPVHCDLKYLGSRPYFDPKGNKCTVAPVCLASAEKDLPDTVYNPISNTCRDLDNPLTIKDIYEIGAGMYKKLNIPHIEDEMVIELKSNCSTISQNLNLVKDIMFGRLYPYYGDTSQYCSCCRAAIASIFLTIATLCGFVLGCIFGLHTLVCFWKKWSSGELQEKWKLAMENLRKRGSRSMDGKASATDYNVKNALIRELIAKDWPLGYMHSNVKVCERMSRQLKSKKRYRGSDIGSQISLQRAGDDESSSTSSSDDENKKFF